MSATIYLIPKEGLTVRDPDNRVPLPPEGAEKPRTGYWLRRLQDGDVTLANIPVEIAPKAMPIKTKPSAKE
jgi:hypothetical protein